VNVVIVLLLVNALLVHAPRRRRRGSRDRRRRQHFRQPLELLALPLDFADAFAALAADVLGQLDEAEDVFLLWGLAVLCLISSGFLSRAETYVAEVLDHVEEFFRLLVLVAHFLDCFLDHQVFGDFGPHLVLGFAL